MSDSKQIKKMLNIGNNKTRCDLNHKLKDLIMSEFAYDLSKYEDEGEAKVNNVTENLVKLFSLYIFRKGAELLPDFLYKDSCEIRIGYHGDSEVSEEWEDYLKKLGNCG